MKFAIHTNAFRDVIYSEAVSKIGNTWPEVYVEASTCREHLHKYLSTWPDVITLANKPQKEVAIISGGWCDFVTGQGTELGGILDKQLHLSHEWGIPIRLFLTNPTMEPYNTPENVFEAILELCCVVSRWKDFGHLKVCIENHGGITANPTIMNTIICKARKTIPSKIIGTTLDPANYAKCGRDPVMATTEMDPSYIYHVHAKDIDRGGNWCEPGAGVMRNAWTEIIDYLKEIRYQGLVTVEYEGKDIQNRIGHITNGLNFLAERFNA